MLKSKRFSFLNQFISFFVSCSLIFSQSVAYAVPSLRVPEGDVAISEIASSGPSVGRPRNDIIKTVSIPSELGKIEESFQGSSDKTIIYIQDAHDSLEAQENIAKTINYMVEHYGAKTVYEEGYEGPVPTDEYFGFMKDPVVKEKVSYFLMDKLRIGGAEYAHINRKTDFKLIGADNIKLHLENIKQYRETAALSQETKQDLQAAQSEISRLANQRFSKELKEWMKLKERLDKNQISLLDYLKRLTLSLRAERSNLRTRIASDASHPRNDNKLISLLLAAESSKGPKIPEQVKSLDAKVLFTELERLENDYANMQLNNEQDKKTFQYYKGLQLLSRLDEIKLTPTEFEAVKENFQKLKTDDLAKFVAKSTNKPVVLFKRWEQNIQNAIRFYELAGARDHSLEKNFDEFLKSKNEKLAVVVFGGFHKDEIKQTLRAKNLSYSIIMPVITSVDQKHQDYYKQLMSMGSYPFEMPMNLAKAARAITTFYRAILLGPQPIRSELRTLSSIVERNQNLEWPLLNRNIEAQLNAQLKSRSEVRASFIMRPGDSAEVIPDLLFWITEIKGNSVVVSTVPRFPIGTIVPAWGPPNPYAVGTSYPFGDYKVTFEVIENGTKVQVTAVRRSEVRQSTDTLHNLTVSTPNGEALTIDATVVAAMWRDGIKTLEDLIEAINSPWKEEATPQDHPLVKKYFSGDLEAFKKFLLILVVGAPTVNRARLVGEEMIHSAGAIGDFIHLDRLFIFGISPVLIDFIEQLIDFESRGGFPKGAHSSINKALDTIAGLVAEKSKGGSQNRYAAQIDDKTFQVLEKVLSDFNRSPFSEVQTETVSSVEEASTRLAEIIESRIAGGKDKLVISLFNRDDVDQASELLAQHVTQQAIPGVNNIQVLRGYDYHYQRAVLDDGIPESGFKDDGDNFFIPLRSFNEFPQDYVSRQKFEAALAHAQKFSNVVIVYGFLGEVLMQERKEEVVRVRFTSGLSIEAKILPNFIDAQKEADLKVEFESLKPRSEVRAKYESTVQQTLQSFDDERVVADFNRIKGSDAKVKELMYTAQHMGETGQVIVYNVDSTDSVGKLFLDLKLEKQLVTESGGLEKASQKYLKGYQGGVVVLSDKASLVEAAALRSELRKVGINEDRTYLLADEEGKAGTVGAGLQGIEFYRLNKQLPDFMAFDTQRRFVITDLSVMASWRDLYEKNVAFARAA